jgi:hypothetical protein
MTLQSALVFNGFFSGISAVIIMFTYMNLTSHIQLPPFIWIGIAVGLGLFSIQLFFMAKIPSLAKKLALSVVISDVLWVLGSLLIAYIFESQVSVIGFIIIVVINTLVGTLAWLQYRGLKNLAYLKGE